MVVRPHRRGARWGRTLSSPLSVSSCPTGGPTSSRTMIHFQDLEAHNGRLNIANEATRTARFSCDQATAILAHCQQTETDLPRNPIDLDYTNEKKLKSPVMRVRPSLLATGKRAAGNFPDTRPPRRRCMQTKSLRNQVRVRYEKLIRIYSYHVTGRRRRLLVNLKRSPGAPIARPDEAAVVGPNLLFCCL